MIRLNKISCFVVDGGWTVWSDWSECNVTCGIGTTDRFRACTNPEPMHNGIYCDGDAEETNDCDTGVDCPSKSFNFNINIKFELH